MITRRYTRLFVCGHSKLEKLPLKDIATHAGRASVISLPFEQRDLWRGAGGRVWMHDRTADPPVWFQQLIVDQAVCVFRFHFSLPV